MKLLSKSDIIKEYKYWSALKSPTARQARRRGYEFEKILYSLLFSEKLEPISSYKTVGEQIDGSFMYLGQTFLLEAKWHKDPLPVSSVYSFKGKVDGKFHTSSGIYISMAGYSNDVSDALRFGKSINVLLFDKQDMDTIILSGMLFSDLLKFKIRQAGDTGNAYVPYNSTKAATGIIKSSPVYSVSKAIYTRPSVSDSGIDLGEFADPLFLIFCEGPSEKRVLSELLQKMIFFSPVAFQFKVLNGAYSLLKELPVLVNNIIHIRKKERELRGVILVLDNDIVALKLLNDFKDTLNEALLKSASGIDLLSVRLNLDNIETLLNDSRKLERIPEIRQILSFIGNRVYEEYNEEEVEGEKVIKRILESIRWDWKRKSAIVPEVEKERSSIEFRSLDKLVSYLENEAEGAATNIVSWDRDFLETYEPPDFREIIYLLLEDYLYEIEKIGWRLN